MKTFAQKKDWLVRLKVALDEFLAESFQGYNHDRTILALTKKIYQLEQEIAEGE